MNTKPGFIVEVLACKCGSKVKVTLPRTTPQKIKDAYECKRCRTRRLMEQKEAEASLPYRNPLTIVDPDARARFDTLARGLPVISMGGAPMRKY